MTKSRVYELARELQVESKAIIAKLKSFGVEVSSHQSTLTDAQILQIKGAFGKSPQAAESAADQPKVIRRRRVEQSDAPQTVEAPQPASPTMVLRRSSASATTDGPLHHAKAADNDEHSIAAQVARVKQAVISGANEIDPPAQRESVRFARSAGKEEEVSSEIKNDTVAEMHAAAASSVSAAEETDVADTSSLGGAHATGIESSLKAAEEIFALGGTSTPEKTPKAQTPAAKEFSGGATIVRKASPAEIADHRTQTQRASEARQRPPQQRPFSTSGGSSSGSPIGGRPPRSEGPSSQAGLSGSSSGSKSSYRVTSKPMESLKWGGMTDPGPVPSGVPGRSHSKFTKSKTREEFDDNVESKKAPAIAKTKREANLNLRSLLLGDEEDDDGAVEEQSLKKTVYTPMSPAKKKDLRRRKDLKKTQITTPRAAYRVVKMGADITIAELGKQLGVKGAELIKKAMGHGVMVGLNQSVDFDMASILVADYGFEIENVSVSEDDILNQYRDSNTASQGEAVERAPIVTIMGHVDHGKTSILDAIRKAKVAQGEFGGITQHIGAYSVLTKRHKRISFLDTPGHEAFSAMRQRGAKVTDIIILVVAADDGVKPQTVEAISHARAAEVPIIVAINKIDKPSINLDRVYRELMEHGIQSEEWGGETQFVKVSALQGTGLEDLLEAITLQAEVLELRAIPLGEASGVVVESHLDPARGPVATVMVQHGLVKVGDIVIAGTTYGKVRAMFGDDGKKLEEAGPSIPVQIIGLESSPMAGDQVNTVKSEKIAKELTSLRKDKIRAETKSKSGAATLEMLLGQVASGEKPVVPLIIKADTQGSVEALFDSLKKVNTDAVENRVIHRAVGAVTESDIRLAATSGAVIIGFNVRLNRMLQDLAEKSGVPVKYFSIIYDVVDAVKAMMAGKLPPILTEVVQGHAEVRQTIRVPKIGMIAGTAVTDGKILRNSKLRLIRNDVVIFEGKVNSLRRFKDDVKEVATGYECGISIEGCTDIQEGDIIESFIIEESQATL